jgi:hypothetical protein
MAEFISSWGRSAEQISGEATCHFGEGCVAVRVTIPEFPLLRDTYGHVIRDLPGSLCGFLRAQPPCRYAEVLHTPNDGDAVVIALFENQVALAQSVADLRRYRFELSHLTLPCPPLETAVGSLEELLRADPLRQ